TDDSVNKVKDYMSSDERIKLYSFNERKGVGAARNYGVSKASGEYIYFLDSDDFLPPETLSLLIQHIGSNHVIIGSIKRSYLSSSFTVTFQGHFNPKTYTDNKYKVMNNLLVNNYLIKRNFIEQYKLKHSEKVEFYSDAYFLIDLLKHTDYIQKINEAIYFKRLRNDPILNPSLNQSDGIDLAKNFLIVLL